MKWYYSSVTLWATEFWFIPGSFSLLLKDNSLGCCCRKIEVVIYILGLPVLCTFHLVSSLEYFSSSNIQNCVLSSSSSFYLSSFYSPFLSFSSFSLPSSFSLQHHLLRLRETPTYKGSSRKRVCHSKLQYSWLKERYCPPQYKIVFPSPTEMKITDAVHSKLLDKNVLVTDNNPNSHV